MQAGPAGDQDAVVTASAGLTPAEDDAVLIAKQTQTTPAPELQFADSLDAIDPIESGIPYLMVTFGGAPFPLSTHPCPFSPSSAAHHLTRSLFAYTRTSLII